jgi:acetyl esterase
MNGEKGLGREMLAFAEYLRSADELIAGPDIASLRGGTRALRVRANRVIPDIHRVERGRFEDFDYDIYRPSKPATKAAVFLHGGGFSHLDVDVYDPVLRRIALAGDIVVIAPNYPLVPETPFPENLHACERFVRHVAAEAPRLGVAPDLGLMGDSAGANLALGCALIQRDAAQSAIRALGLVYGAFDMVNEGESHRLYGSGDLPLTTAGVRASLDFYIPDPARRRNPLASPILADLSRLPPTFLSVASHDVLYDENIEMARRLGLAGVDVTLRVYPGTIHGFFEAESVSGDPSASRAMTDIAAFMASA